MRPKARSRRLVNRHDFLPHPPVADLSSFLSLSSTLSASLLPTPLIRRVSRAFQSGMDVTRARLIVRHRAIKKQFYTASQQSRERRCAARTEFSLFGSDNSRHRRSFLPPFFRSSSSIHSSVRSFLPSRTHARTQGGTYRAIIAHCERYERIVVLLDE